MNTVDLIVVVIFLGVFTAAFFAGIGRSLVGLLSLIIATLLAAFFYSPVGVVMSHLFIPIDRNIADFGAFLLLMLAAGVGADYLLLRSFRISRLQSHISMEFRGGVVGVIGLILLSVILSTTMLTVLTQVSNNTVHKLPSGWGTNWLVSEYDGSILVDQVMRLSPYVYDSVDTATPGIVPAILQPVTNP
jgi:uncharacterized membrane protein required for colicin V production